MNNKNIEAIENTGNETYLDIFKKPDYKKIEELKRQRKKIKKTRILLRKEQKYT